ncbi:hypothetical protein ARMSODRAFT_1021412 [Armillaria solidipes]|uniref:Uncharacterized protein n=1 Tax=Armillaria solidipes TaxID=1076256 RepID=A0A2H3BAA5_9AGAR|nr:hypothetical protein ARMSODRAFT_1021412 [Armillaria solidipes]
MPSPSDWETAPTWMESTSNRFNHFNQDRETFGGWEEDPGEYDDEYDDGRSEELDNVAPWTQRAGNYAPYPQYNLPRYPFPLPDSPPTHHVRQHGQYHGPRYPRLYAGQGDRPKGSNMNDNDNDEAARQRLAEEMAAKRKEAAEEAGRKLQRIAELEKLLNNTEMDHRDHATQWGLPQSANHDKGKKPETTQSTLPLLPNPHRPLWRRDD